MYNQWTGITYKCGDWQSKFDKRGVKSDWCDMIMSDCIFFYIPYRMVKSCCMHLPSSWFHAAEINNQLPFADCVQLPVVEVFVCCSCAVIPGLMYCTHCQFNQLTTMIKILKISLHHNNTVCWLNITSTSCCSNNLFVLPQNLVCHTHSTWICFTNKNVIYKVEIITTVYHLIQ